VGAGHPSPPAYIATSGLSYRPPFFSFRQLMVLLPLRRLLFLPPLPPPSAAAAASGSCQQSRRCSLCQLQAAPQIRVHVCTVFTG